MLVKKPIIALRYKLPDGLVVLTRELLTPANTEITEQKSTDDFFARN